VESGEWRLLNNSNIQKYGNLKKSESPLPTENKAPFSTSVLPGPSGLLLFKKNKKNEKLHLLYIVILAA
jgi:hypothetical protein